MEQIDPGILISAQGLLDQFLQFSTSLLLPSRLLQVAIVAGVYLLSLMVAWFLRPRIETALRSMDNVPKWQMRLLILLKNRVRGLCFVLLIWLSVAIIKEITPFPSRRYLVVIAATLASAWVVIGLLTRLIRNRFMRRVVSWGGWIYVTLLFLGFMEPVTGFLDSLGVQFGSFRISVLAVLKALVVTGFLFTMARLLTQALTRRISENTDISPSIGVLAVKMVQVVLYGAAVFLGLKAVGFDLTGLAVLSGAIGVGLGFGLQKVVSNLVSGIIILLDKSIKPGDVISIGDTFGWIEALGARYVSVVTRDGREYLIPNEDLITGQVVNWSHSNDLVRVDLDFGTSYADDPHLVRRVAIEAAQSVGRVLPTETPVCHITGFGDNSVNYVLRFWIRDPREGLTNVRGTVFLALWDAFKSNGISIPFPQREVRILPDAAGGKATQALATTAEQSVE